MSSYKYATVLEAQSDGKPPNDNIEKGDKIVRAGKHETDSIEYIADDNDIAVVEFEQVACYESDTKMGEREAQKFAKDQWFDGENDG
jgi:hypothetical protein